MKFLLLSSLCSEKKYGEVYRRRSEPMLDTNQNFLMSVVNGLKETCPFEVSCISSLPVSFRCYPERVLKRERDVQDGIEYTYCGGLNLPILRNLTVAASMRKETKAAVEKSGADVIVLCDVLTAEASAMVGWLKRRGILTIGIVTDIPMMAENMAENRGLRSVMANAYGAFANHAMKQFDAYILLSEQMNELCNQDRVKPYMVMECIIDSTRFDGILPKPLSDKPVVLYAGKLLRSCGVVTLAKTARHLADECEIWLYGGHGDCMEELQQEAEKTSNLNIHGVVPLHEILRIEAGSALLVNPRPPEERFTRYSFPSKTVEYMLSGVPVLMFELPTLPEEYNEHLFFIQENTSAAMADQIRQVIKMPKEERVEMGKRAKQFVAQTKNQQCQAKRVLEFIEAVRENHGDQEHETGSEGE